MKKKMLFVMATIVAFALFVPSVMAADVTSDLAAAVSAANDGDTLTLTEDVEVTSVITIDKELTLDLAGFDVLFKNNSYLLVEGGNLTVTGEGTMAEETPYYAPILVKGSADVTASNYSVVNVGEGVTLEGWSGVFIRQNATNTAYGVNITVNCTINSFADSDGVTGHGVYVNGSIKHTTNAPVITLGSTANITSEGVGIYAAGYAVWNINGATISGVEAGLGIKSGEFNITDATIIATGEDKTPTAGYGNGINPSGAAIQIESNTGYAGNVELNIEGGTFTSEKGIAVYEYLDTTATDTAVSTIVISGGEFTSVEGKPVMALSEEFVEEHTETEFIEGGVYKSGNVETLVGTLDGGYVPADKAIVLTLYEVTDKKIGESLELLLTKGALMDQETFEKTLKDALAVENKYIYDAAYADKDLKTKFDFTKALDADTEMYLSVTTNPKTGDINLVALIGTILVGMVGMAIVLRKRFAKGN